MAAAREIFLPALCLHCETPLRGDERGVCGTCLDVAERDPQPRCPRCGIVSSDAAPCLGCAADPPPQVGTVVGGDHAGPRRSIVLALKHRGRDELAPLLARSLAARVRTQAWHRRITAVVDVPSHPLHRIRRGHAAATVLARAVADDLGRPYRSVLRRRGLRRQVDLSRRQRLDLPARRFAVRTGRGVPRAVLVIDDVTTTGATLRRAAQALLEAGAEVVWCAAASATPETRRPV